MTLSESSDLLLNKYCNELSSDDKRQRKRALENIKNNILGETCNLEYVASSFELVQKNLIRCFKDNSEVVRETSILIVTKILKIVPAKELYLSSIMPVISERLSGDTIQENSEEVRLCLVILLSELIKRNKENLFHYLDDFINIFVKTIVDPHPKVKKESCDAVAELAKAIPQHFHMQSESLITPLIQTLGHQQYRIRVAGISSIGFVIRFGNNKSVNDVCGPLAERLFDQHHAVRSAVARVVGMWLIELFDRYSYFYKLIPLMLTSLSEEIPELRKEAEDLWIKVGQQYMSENETDLKDQMDYLKERLDHYPPNVLRPNLGCRTLVQRELSKYLPAIVLELDDWKADVRVKSAQLMCVTVQHAESHITQHLERTLPALYKACADTDLRVVDNIILAAEMLGYFVPPEVYWRLMKPSVQESTGPGPLHILASVVRTSQRCQLQDQLHSIAETLSSESLCNSKQGQYQWQLLNVVGSLIALMQQDTAPVAQQLFTVCVSVLGLAAEPAISTRAKELLVQLAQVSDLTLQELYKRHTSFVLKRVEAGVPQWSIHSPHRYIFEALLTNAGAAVGQNIEDVLSVLEVGLKPDTEPEATLHTLMAVSYVLTHSDTTLTDVPDLAGLSHQLCTKVLHPQLVWRAGRSAEALRTAAVGCLLAALDLAPCSHALADDLVPLLLGLVEDSAFKTRHIATLSLLSIVRALKTSKTLNAQDIDSIFIVVMKRLDDNSDSVRETAVRLLCELFSSPWPEDYNLDAHRSSLEALFDTMLLHLDDPVPAFQDKMLDALKEISSVHPQLLRSRIQLDNFRNKTKCEQLITFLEQLKV